MKEKIKIGYIGLGRRGRSVLEHCMVKMKDVEITILCDIYEPWLESGKKMVTNAGGAEPKITTDWHDVLAEELDAVFLMAGWEGRAEMASAFMEKGVYTGIEVGCAFDIRECYQLLEVYERTKTPLMMLENCCYGRRELMVLHLVKQGLLGEIVHCDGGYHHSLIKDDLLDQAYRENHHYRLDSYINRNCEQYPSHELLPLMKVLAIHRGNRMVSLASFASKARGLQTAAARMYGPDDKFANIEYKQGDIVTTVITCANGETIHLCLDTTLPRPFYSRNFTVRGTEGMYTEERKTLYLEGVTGKDKEAEFNEEEMFKQYDHPLEVEYQAMGGNLGGHGGMDWLICRAFVEAVKHGVNTPIDAYDTIAVMAVAPLSEKSIKEGGAPQEFPDFTNGKWRDREPAPRTKYCLDEVCVDPDTPIAP
ncbi:MAG: Gfo/Idh/MocA family oxidoreductase [Clostridia bacterium]|nr:Gfo/Idh/MocA family oxidoreductase [Clostridia bacterium]